MKILINKHYCVKLPIAPKPAIKLIVQLLKDKHKELKSSRVVTRSEYKWLVAGVLTKRVR